MPVSNFKDTILTATLLFISIVCGQLYAQTPKDLYRPACTSHRCQMIKAYLKSHYCGESPFGNGPDDGCDIRSAKKPGPGVKVSVDFACKSNDVDGTSKCLQMGQPSPEIRNILISELRRLGLPAQADKDVKLYRLGSHFAEVVSDLGELRACKRRRSDPLPSDYCYRPKRASALAAKGAIPKD